MVVTEVGKRKTEDEGVRERQSEREGTRKYTILSKSDRKRKKY